MDWVLFLRWLHIIGATVLFGTGAGIAFFMLMAHRTRDAHLIAHVAASVVVADTIFTATAVIAQPVTGALLAHALGWDLAKFRMACGSIPTGTLRTVTIRSKRRSRPSCRSCPPTLRAKAMKLATSDVVCRPIRS